MSRIEQKTIKNPTHSIQPNDIWKMIIEKTKDKSGSTAVNIPASDGEI